LPLSSPAPASGDGRREASYTVRASVSQHFSGSATVARAAGGAVSVRAGRRVRMLRTRVCHSAHHLSVRAVCFVPLAVGPQSAKPKSPRLRCHAAAGHRATASGAKPGMASTARGCGAQAAASSAATVRDCGWHWQGPGPGPRAFLATGAHLAHGVGCTSMAPTLRVARYRVTASEVTGGPGRVHGASLAVALHEPPPGVHTPRQPELNQPRGSRQCGRRLKRAPVPLARTR
jgi:hypothetical protein